MLSYIKQVHALNGFSKEMRQLVDDLIRYGNCFNMVHYIDKSVKDGDVCSSNYSVPANKRISPFDIVFNPTASSFVETPKIIRSLVSLGEFHDLYTTADTETELSEEDYKAILEKNYGKKIRHMYLVRLHPNNPNQSYILYKVPNLRDSIEELFELRLKSL